MVGWNNKIDIEKNMKTKLRELRNRTENNKE